MGLIYGDDENNNEKIKLCMVSVKKLANLQLIKPCRVLLERKVETVRLDKVDHVDEVMHRMEMLPKGYTHVFLMCHTFKSITSNSQNDLASGIDTTGVSGVFLNNKQVSQFLYSFSIM